MFRDRADAGERLALRLKKRSLIHPLVLAIPRGGVGVGAVIATELGAELDIVLSRKIRAPGQPELALGAISEDGQIYLSPYVRGMLRELEPHIKHECEIQKSEIKRRQELFRSVRPQVALEGRSIILTDDGIATGATLIAALQTIKLKKPKEIIVAVPVGSSDRVAEIRSMCDDVICLMTPEDFGAVGQFYENFEQVEDEEVLEMLRKSLAEPKKERPH